ncbi:MAG: hypothetical protein LBH28_04915 [Oscillospiraceae bacterium]|jgi:hypothetical protein|nr:hypothetical protein [Oscillospiraceae bacterium]
MSNYPDWVIAFKEKGTSIKKVGNEYYLYSATSKRVPGKKYPQPVEAYIGLITKEGVVRTNVRKISTDKVKVYEYGMSYALQALLPDAFLVNSHDRETLRFAFLHIVKYLTPRSYLLRGEELPDLNELHISLNMQIKRYERLAGIAIEDLRPLSELYLVETRECDMLSETTPEMLGIFARLGVEFNAV